MIRMFCAKTMASDRKTGCGNTKKQSEINVLLDGITILDFRRAPTKWARHLASRRDVNRLTAD
jgi:hypothetical protein